MNLPPRWVAPLAAAGHEAQHWAAIGPGTAADTEIMAHAVAHGFVVLTHDLDFGDILAASGAAGPSVVQLRADDLLAPETLAAVLRALRDAQPELMAGALVSVDLHRQRMRLLPLAKG